jgi:hypothetical protein
VSPPQAMSPPGNPAPGWQPVLANRHLTSPSVTSLQSLSSEGSPQQGELSTPARERLQSRVRWHEQEMQRLQSRLERYSTQGSSGSPSRGQSQGQEGQGRGRGQGVRESPVGFGSGSRGGNSSGSSGGSGGGGGSGGDEEMMDGGSSWEGCSP